MSHWVLTTQVNAYDQFGEYYMGSWDEKPKIQDLIQCDHEELLAPNEDQARCLIEKGFATMRPSSSTWQCWKLFNK